MLNLKPLRKPRANKVSTTVFHYSNKLNRQVWCESNLEWNVAILLDQDPSVTDYCEQGIHIPNKDKTKWTPDFVVEYNNSNIQVIEVKYSIEILDPENRKIFEDKYDYAREWCKNQGYEFLVVTEKTIQKDARIENCRKLMEAKLDYNILAKIKPHVIAKVKSNAGITISQMVSHMESWLEDLEISEDDIISSIYLMLYHNLFEFTFENQISKSTMLFTQNGKVHALETLETWFKIPYWRNIHPKSVDKVSLVDLHAIPKDHLNEAEKRYKIIQPLIASRSNESVSQIAKANNVANSTIWRWINLYRKNYDIRDLVPKYNKSGRKSIDHDLWEVGFEAYLKMERPSIRQAYEIMEAKALTLNLKVPHYDTFRRRIKKLNKEKTIKKRFGTRKSEKQFLQSFESFPHANWALQTVQIDHSPIDVRVVDSENRLVIDRPYLTIALDVYSRVILGYALTFDRPSRLSIAMTLLSCIETKESSLLKVREEFPELDEEYLNIIENSEWKNVHGLPYTLHMDNGSDFTSKDIIKFGKAYQIHLHYRPVKGSQYGAHVERVFGTLNRRLHILRGTTFSNISEKGDYDSDGMASWTINELEARLITEIVRYHDDYHEGIKSTPLTLWKDSFNQGNDLQTTNLNLPIDLEKFKLDVLPSEQRTVQNKGISLFNIYYNSPVLRKWIKSKNPLNSKLPRKFTIRYDPRDIRSIFFYDPENQEYLTIPTSDILIKRLFDDKPLSMWEMNSARTKFVNDGKSKVNKNQRLKIVSMQQKMDQITNDKTSLAKRKRTELRKQRSNQTNQYHSNQDDDQIQFNQKSEENNWIEIKKRRKKRVIEIKSANEKIRKPNRLNNQEESE